METINRLLREHLKRMHIINTLIETRGYETYLEIGLDNPFLNFENIECPLKESVDPYDEITRFSTVWGKHNLEKFLNHLTYRMTSDEFFASYPAKKYDIIFIDGLHIESQADKDIKNSLLHLNPGGVVVIHDCLPTSEEIQTEIYSGGGLWVGTVWKSIVKYSLFTDLDIRVVDCDWGVGIIEYGSVSAVALPERLDMEFEEFNKRKYELINIIEPFDFLKNIDRKPVQGKL